jgi:hypothetical protein
MPNDVGKFHFLSLPFTQTANELSISTTKFFFKRDSASLDLEGGRERRTVISTLLPPT